MISFKVFPGVHSDTNCLQEEIWKETARNYTRRKTLYFWNFSSDENKTNRDLQYARKLNVRSQYFAIFDVFHLYLKLYMVLKLPNTKGKGFGKFFCTSLQFITKLSIFLSTTFCCNVGLQLINSDINQQQTFKTKTFGPHQLHEFYTGI